MVVYMYLNTVTEMVYVGSSKYGLDRRHRAHKKAVRLGKSSRFYKALATWPDEVWERIVLEKFDSEDSLDSGEKRWIAECSAMDDSVGYNTYNSMYLRTAVAGGIRMQLRTFSDAERESLAERGRMGAAVSRAMNPPRLKKRSAFSLMSPEEKSQFFRECGKRGAKRSAQNVMARNES